MRVGHNPAKAVQHVVRPERVTVALITYIPVQAGYYAESLAVLQRCLESIWANTDMPYDLLVFDNASCPEVQAYLSDVQQQGRIQYLTLSEKNIGKSGAWNFIFSAAPGEIIAYADSDVYFYPGWLSAQVDVLQRVPQLGMLTGMPIRTSEEFSTSTVAWAESNPQVDLARGHFLSWEDYWRHSRSLGAEEEQARQRHTETDDIVIQMDGKSYFVGAAHFQFTAPKAALESILPIPYDRPMGQVRRLDIALNERGYLRLSTSKWWVQHMGNTLADPELESANQFAKPVVVQDRRNSFWKFKPVNALVSWVYHRAFEILYKD